MVTVVQRQHVWLWPRRSRVQIPAVTPAEGTRVRALFDSPKAALAMQTTDVTVNSPSTSILDALPGEASKKAYPDSLEDVHFVIDLI